MEMTQACCLDPAHLQRWYSRGHTEEGKGYWKQTGLATGNEHAAQYQYNAYVWTLASNIAA